MEVAAQQEIGDAVAIPTSRATDAKIGKNCASGGSGCRVNPSPVEKATADAKVRASSTVALRNSAVGRMSSRRAAPKLLYDGKRCRSGGMSFTNSSRPATG